MLLVTGGAGYIGSHTVRALQARGYETMVLDNFVKGHRDLVFGPLVEGDLRDEAVLDGLFARYPVEAVVHFAAFSLVGESMADPEAYVTNNVGGTLALLRAMRRAGVSRFVLSSTAAVYGEPRQVPIDEEAPTEPTNTYGETKLFIEKICRRYAAAYGLGAIFLRYFNAAGADPEGHTGEHHVPESHLIPLLLDVALGRREALTVYGADYPTPDGTCVRDYVHVTDLAEAHVRAVERLAERGPGAEAFNLGNGRGYSVAQVVEEVRKVTGHPIPVVSGDRRPGDPAVLVASSARAEEVLGWRQRYAELSAIVETAWSWHRRRFD